MPNSYNGWPASDNKAAINIQPFGDNVGLPFPGGVKGGDVTTVLAYVCTQLHYRVEACVAGWDWGYTYKANVNNPSQLSCHASGTAVDWNAPLHPNGSSGTFTDAQVGEIYAILNEVQGAVDWLEGYDEMHFEVAVDAGVLSNIAATLPTTGEPAPEPPEPEPEPEPEDDMPRRLITVYDADLNPLGMALDGPTGVVSLGDENEMACVQAVIDDNTAANGAEIDVYNAVLARGAARLAQG